ncbi:hypothetical protein [Rhizobium sp. NRK18]|uniref:hypothetical protein n=1 Tax=Rhizobium sp. NRK18 TaxID=2964667 RepID=UPI0021C33946|nr:hypothetical protein [Rhizobium sp. NRK18]MCQ2003418.1 hypothetical protein [Rhizobium sp. NRK18]
MTPVGSVPHAGDWRRNAALAFVLFLAGTGLILLSSIREADVQGNLLRWALQPSLSFDRLLPLIGFGFLLAQLPARSRLVAIALLIAGMAAGFGTRDIFLKAVAPLPGAGTHFFYAGPLATLAVGLCLVLPVRWRPWPALPVAFVIGMLLAILVSLSDLTLHDRFFVPQNLAASLWTVALAAALGLLARFPWAGTATQIMGSWLIAISLLYGGAFAVSKDREFHPPAFAAAPSGEGDYPGFATVLGELDAQGDGKP